MLTVRDMLSPGFLILSILTGERWNLRVFLICISLNIKDFEHFFSGASQPFGIAQLRILFSSVPPFVIWLFDCLESNFLGSLYILDISPLSDGGLVKIFSQFVGCHFVLLIVPFAL